MIDLVLFGGGCFWILEPAFASLQGVLESQAGYSGGQRYYPRYEQVRKQNTGHVQVVLVRYNRNEISFSVLLDAFFSLHDPTSLDRQDPDIGREYASVIFYTNQQQRLKAKQHIKQLELQLKKPIVTRLEQGQVFWPAEIEHQAYYLNNFLSPYSVDVIQPKLRVFAQQFKEYIPIFKQTRRIFDY